MWAGVLKLSTEVHKGGYPSWGVRLLCLHYPFITPRPVEALQAGPVGLGSEEVQVAVRRRDRLVSEPRLDRPRVDTAGQPQAGGGVPLMRNSA